MLQVDCRSKNILLLKVGGSSITEKGKFETLDVEGLEWFSKTVSSTVNDDYLSAGINQTKGDNPIGVDKPEIIIIHGAGSFGHHTAKQYGLRGRTSPPPDGMFLTKDLRTGISKTRHSVKKLNSAVVSCLIEKGVNAVGISPCLNIPGLMAHGGDEYNGATLLVRSICETLSAGLVPVIHGDAGLYGKYCEPSSKGHHQSMSAGILGGDTLIEIIATHPLINKRILKAVFLTDVEGVFTEDPKFFPDATLVRNIFVDPLSGQVMNEVSASGSSHDHDVTGGLEAKLGAAASIAKAGVDVIVAKCGSDSAKIAMSSAIPLMNLHGNTLIRIYQK